LFNFINLTILQDLYNENKQSSSFFFRFGGESSNFIEFYFVDAKGS